LTARVVNLPDGKIFLIGGASDTNSRQPLKDVYEI